MSSISLQGTKPYGRVSDGISRRELVCALARRNPALTPMTNDPIQHRAGREQRMRRD